MVKKNTEREPTMQQLFTKQQAAQYLGCSPKDVDTLLLRRALRYSGGLLGRPVIHRSVLEDFVRPYRAR
jgi:hypothetical protein